MSSGDDSVAEQRWVSTFGLCTIQMANLPLTPPAALGGGVSVCACLVCPYLLLEEGGVTSLVPSTGLLGILGRVAFLLALPPATPAESLVNSYHSVLSVQLDLVWPRRHNSGKHFQRGGMTHPECGQYHSRGWGLTLNDVLVGKVSVLARFM